MGKQATGGRLGLALAEIVAAGGYPAALARSAPHRRAAWYRAYVDTLVQRDVRDLAAIRNLDALPRLLAVVASQTARLVNIADLSGPFQLTRPTIRDYMTLLERVFLLDELPPWHSNRLSRLVKTAKLHAGDTGVACALLGLGGDELWADRELYGQMLETFVYGELQRQASGHGRPITFHHLRDRDGTEVDLVLERSGRQLVGIEVKASSTVRGKDFYGLRKLHEAVGDRLAVGVVLYDGEATAAVRGPAVGDPGPPPLGGPVADPLASGGARARRGLGSPSRRRPPRALCRRPHSGDPLTFNNGAPARAMDLFLVAGTLLVRRGWSYHETRTGLDDLASSRG